jgi:cell division protease FtsH
MKTEAALGAGIAVTAFLAVQGYNIVPVVILAVLVFLLYQTTGLKGFSRNYVSVHSGPKTRNVTFEGIGGQEMAKKELLEALEFIRNLETVKKLGIRPLKGILLSGPPGTGKTLLAKAAAQYTDSSFLSTSGSEFIEVYAGVGAQRVRQLFEKVKEQAKKEEKNSAVVFIDEIDVLGGKRGQHSSHMEYDQTLNQLLVEMDGIDTSEEIKTLIIAATNRPDILDEALLRPGRFDRIVNLRLPDKEGRLQILKIHAANKPLASDVDLEVIAKATFGFSGAALESLTNEAAILAMRDKQEKINKTHFADAMDKVMMGEKLDRRPNNAEMERVAVHEVGHALISEMVNPGSVSVITVTSRGNALGYMRQIPPDDLYLYTQNYLEQQIDVCIAGTVSEETVLGNRSTGNTGDYQQAIKYAKTMLFAGMTPFGIVSPEDAPKSLLQQAINETLQAREGKVREIIEPKRDFIRTVVSLLLENESVTGEEFRRRLTLESETSARRSA